jgi:putative transcriptional regulator
VSSPRHHPSDEQLLDLARGVLPPGPALVIGAHVGACAACAATVRLAESLGGALLAELPPAEMSPGALQRTLERLDDPPPPSAPRAAHPPDWIRVPGEVLAAARRKRWAAPGVWVAGVAHDRATGARSYLLGVGPNVALPLHSHRGSELICVLKGAYQDRGAMHGPGDFAHNDESVEHRPKATGDGECVCLIAADHRLAPRSLVARLLQPVVGI